MDTLLLSASKVFMFLAFWVGVPSALLGMLLVLGFQQKSTAAIIIGLLGLGGAGCFGLGINLEGLVTGEALSLSKWGAVTVHKADDPQNYWLAISVWLSGSVALIGVIGWLILRQFTNPNISVERDASPQSGSRPSL
jgi:hypothetical protein